MNLEGAKFLDDAAVFSQPCALVIGIFDGLHLGHKSLLREAKKYAKNEHEKLFVLTFSPHPCKILEHCKGQTKLIYPLEIRIELLKSAGADAVFIKNFDKNFASESPEEFLKFLRKKFPNFKAIVTGENFKFAKNAEGNSAWLKENQKKYAYEYEAVSGMKDGQNLISSTRLRKALQTGDMPEFERLAGRRYFMQGKVSAGKKLGRVLGFPTLNLPWNEECVPPFGVYCARLTNLDSNKTYLGVASYGINPSVEIVDPVLETNLFEDVSFGVGTNIKVELIKFLRKEEKFASLDKLKTQIAKDKLEAKKFFENKI